MAIRVDVRIEAHWPLVPPNATVSCVVIPSQAQLFLVDLLRQIVPNLISMGGDAVQEIAEDFRSRQKARMPPVGLAEAANRPGGRMPSAVDEVLGNNDLRITVPAGWTLYRHPTSPTALVMENEAERLTMVEVNLKIDERPPNDLMERAQGLIGGFIRDGTIRSVEPLGHEVSHVDPLRVGYQDFLAELNLSGTSIRVFGRLLIAVREDGRWTECLIYSYPPRQEAPSWRSVVTDVIASFRESTP